MEKKLDDIWEKSLKFKIQQKKREWIDFIVEISKTELNNVLEIGCYDGGTTMFLSHLTKNLITIDQPNPSRFDTYKYFLDDKNLYGSKLLNTITNFNYISGSSHLESTINEVKNLLNGEKLDLLFIDGDHSYEGVKQDYNMYIELVRSGGIIAFHDIHESSFHERHGCFVHNFWKELINEHKDYKVFYCDQGVDNVWGGIGLIYKK